MSPQRSVVPDPELSQRARGEPVRVLLTGSSNLDDPPRDKFGYLISRTDGELKLGAHSVKRVAHGLNVLVLESESTGSRSWHFEATACGVGPSRQADARLPEPRRPRAQGGSGVRANTRSVLAKPSALLVEAVFCLATVVAVSREKAPRQMARGSWG